MRWDHSEARRLAPKPLNTEDYCPSSTDGEHEPHQVEDGHGNVLKTVCICCGRWS